MTTPTPALTTKAPDGAYTIGGGEWNYGQNMTEALGKSMFMLPDLTPENIGTVLRLALERLPLDALKAFQPVLGLAEDLFLNVVSAVTAIVDNLIVKPVLQTVEAFNLWVESTFGPVREAIEQWLADWGAWLTEVFAPFQALVDLIDQNSQNVIEDVDTVVHGINETIWGVTGNEAVSIGPSGIPWAIKHVGAQSTTDNINISGWFEEDLVQRSLLGGCTGRYENSSIHYGSLPTGRSYRVTMTATANGGLLILPKSTPTATFNDKTSGFPVQPGQTYRMSAKVWFPAANAASPGAYIGVRTYDGSGNYDATTVSNVASTKGTWLSLDGTYTVPDNYPYEMMYPFVGYNSPAAGSVMYVDSVSIVPETNTSITDAISVGSGYGPGATPAAAATRLGAVRSTASGAAGGVTTNANNLQDTWNRTYDAHNNTSGSTGQTAASSAAVIATHRSVSYNASSNLQDTWNRVYDAANGTSGSTGQTATSAASVLSTVRSNASGAIDATYQGLGGNSSSGSAATALTAANDTRNNIAEMNQKITALQAQSSSGAFSGNAVSVDFSTYANNTSAFNSSIWTQNYPSGSGSGTWGISSGKTYWTVSGDVNKVGFARYHPSSGVTGTKTDMQMITAVLSSSFGGVGGSGSAFYIVGRMSNAVVGSGSSQYVFVRFLNQSGSTQIQFGYQGGMLGSAITRNIKAGAAYTLELGTSPTGLGQRTFNVYENGNLIHFYQDSGYLTTVGNLMCGIGGMANASGSTTPPQVSAFSFYDTAPPSYKGSAFRATNLSASTISVTGTSTNPFPKDYYSSSGTNTWSTSDYTYTGGTTGTPNTYNRLTVSKEGWYLVNVVQQTTQLGSGGGGISGLVLYKNGSVFSRGPTWNYPANTTTTGMAMTQMIYLVNGDYIQPGYYTNWTHTAFCGDTSGVGTYFQVNFIGNQMPT